MGEETEDVQEGDERGREILRGQRATAIPGFIAPKGDTASPLAVLRWADGEPLTEREAKQWAALHKREFAKGVTRDGLCIEVQRALDPESSRAASRAVASAWIAHGGAGKDKWALFHLFAIAEAHGFDDLGFLCEDMLFIADSPKFHRALYTLDLLDELGSDEALGWIYDALLHVPMGGTVQAKAQEILKRRAKEASVSLDDFLEPLDHHTRTTHEERELVRPERAPFIPEQLTVEVRGEHVVFTVDDDMALAWHTPGSRELVRELPNEDATDSGTKRVVELREKLRGYVDGWRVRFDEAMIFRRLFTVGRIRAQFLDHPILRRMVEGLVWVDEQGRSFRFSDGESLDAEYDDVELEDEAKVRLFTPYDGEQAVLLEWSNHLAEAETFQCIGQLDRKVWSRDEALEFLDSVPDLAVDPDVLQSANEHDEYFGNHGAHADDVMGQMGWYDSIYSSNRYKILPGHRVRMLLSVSSYSTTFGAAPKFESMAGRTRASGRLSDFELSEACNALAALM